MESLMIMNRLGRNWMLRREILDILEKLPGVHLHTSRVKSVESLIEKVINKRYERMFDKDSGYANINADTYKSVVTDLGC